MLVLWHTDLKDHQNKKEVDSTFAVNRVVVASAHVKQAPSR